MVIPNTWLGDMGSIKLSFVIVIVIVIVRGCRCDALRHSANFQPMRAKMPYFLIFTRSVNVGLPVPSVTSKFKHMFNDYA